MEEVLSFYAAGHDDGETLVLNEVENVLGHEAAVEVNEQGNLLMVFWTHPLSDSSVWVSEHSAEQLTELFDKKED